MNHIVKIIIDKPGEEELSNLVIIDSIYLFSVCWTSSDNFVFIKVFVCVDKTFERGACANMSLKRHWFWKSFRDYFPALLVKQHPETVFDPNEVYMFG